MKNKMIYRLPLLLCVFWVFGFVASCIAEFEDGSGPDGSGMGQQEVLLKLHVPGSKQGTGTGTRAVTQDVESKVNDLYILAFSSTDDSFEYWAKAEKGIGDTWTAKLIAPQDEHSQYFLVIANVEGTKQDMLLTAIQNLEPETDTKSSASQKLLAELTDDEKVDGFDVTSDNVHSPFTMCGITATTVIKPASANLLTVDLYRIMARVQVYFGQTDENKGTGLTNFVPETVKFYNFSPSAKVVPNQLMQAVTTPSLPESMTTQKGPITYAVSNNKLERSIYLFEASQSEQAAERPCLVIGGRYAGGETTYYRVDLYDNDQNKYLDLLRNHSYEVVITGVTADGYPRADDALIYDGKNITAGVIMWDETEVGNVNFDGKDYLGISTLEYNVSKAGGILTQKVKASGAWTATLLNEDGNGSPAWIEIVSPTNGQGTDNGKTETMEFRVEELTEEAVEQRTAIMRFTSGALQMDAKVVQNINYSGADGVFVNVLDTVVIENENNVSTLVKVAFGPAGTNLIWTLDKEQGYENIVLAADQAKIGTLTGYQEINEATILIKTNELTSPEITTYKSLLRLSAQSKDGNTVSAIAELLQSNFKVELSKYNLTAYGQGAIKLYVNANAPWTATFDMFQDSRLELFTNGFINKEYTGPADTGLNVESSVIGFDMLEPAFTEKPVTPIIRFVSEHGDLCDVAVNMNSAFLVDNRPHEIVTQRMSFADAVIKEQVPEGGTEEFPYKLVTQSQALKITAAWRNGLSTWVSDPKFSMATTCLRGEMNKLSVNQLLCVMLTAEKSKADPATLEANAIKDGKIDWADIGGDFELKHTGQWGWTDEHKDGCKCHIVCNYGGYNKATKEITLKTHSYSLNPSIYTGQYDHYIYENAINAPEVSIIPLLGSSRIHIINYSTTDGQNENQNLGTDHGKVAKDSLVWNITGLEERDCLFIKQIE